MKPNLHDKIKIYVEIGSVLLAAISALGMFLSLREMRIDREAAYAPCIVMNPVEHSIEWDENLWEDWQSEALDAQPEGDRTIAVNKSFMNLKFVNVGVGAAKNVVLEWDQGNKQRLYDFLISEVPEYEGTCDLNGDIRMDCFNFNGVQYVMFPDVYQLPKQYMYMLAEATEEYYLEIPPQYTLLIHEALKNNVNYEPGFPSLLLNLSYEDIHGNVIEKHYEISIDLPYSRTIDREETYRFSMRFSDGSRSYYEAER